MMKHSKREVKGVLGGGEGENPCRNLMNIIAGTWWKSFILDNINRYPMELSYKLISKLYRKGNVILLKGNLHVCKFLYSCST